MDPFILAGAVTAAELQLKYPEPYFRDRPISVGFSLFASRYRFFGEGTSLTQNPDVLDDLFNPLGQVTTDSANLFTQSTYGATVFATAPLSELFFKRRRFTQFSRVGLTYQISATSITDPEINESADLSQRIPVIYTQPNILTSRITDHCLRHASACGERHRHSLSGKAAYASFALAGLGGDVALISRISAFRKYIPVRRKNRKNPEVFAYRIQAAP